VTIIANYIPFESPEGGPNYFTFGANVRYEIHIKNNAATTTDDITYRFTFSKANQDPTTFFNIRLGAQNDKTTYMCEKSTDGGASWTTIVSTGEVPANNIGPRSIQDATVGLGIPSYTGYMNSKIQTATTSEQIFCGPVDDPFFVDLAGAFDLGNFRPDGLSKANTPKDGLARFNCHTIAMKIPISMLQKSGLPVTSAKNILDPDFVIGVWASASRPQIRTLAAGSESYTGTWVQVSRIGMPLTNEVIIPVGEKDKWNASNPKDDAQFAAYFSNPELALYMDDSKFGGAVPALNGLRIQKKSLGSFDFRNGAEGLFSLKGTAAVAGTALDNAAFGAVLLPDNKSPRAVDILPIFYTGVPNLAPYQLATGKFLGNPLAHGKPFVNNFLPTLGDMLRLNMAVPVTSRTDPNFSSEGLLQAAVLGLTLSKYNDTLLEFIPNMDGFPNGRRLEDDVTTIELQAVSGVALAAIGLWYDDYSGSGSAVTPNLVHVLSFNAGITHNDTTFQASFPYVQQPWRGYDYTAQARF
ncbi:MAG: hypothetical protein JWQ38_1278, partial [Flavipsychrobacter sp.]|nr:hypothetical protein [Flavipsychrobacter sp.]